MLKIEQIQAYLEHKRYSFIENVRLRPSDNFILVYVLREKIAQKVSPGFTSYRQLGNLRKELAKKFGRNVEILLVASEHHHELESVIYQNLNKKFDSKILSFHISFVDQQCVDTWLQVLDMNEEIKNQILASCTKILNSLEINIREVNWTDVYGDLPSTPRILRTIKTNQPVSMNELLSQLGNDYPGLKDRWLSHELDRIRKRGFIVRDQKSNYALTSAALRLVPAGAKYKSSDIDRALALGRRKW